MNVLASGALYTPESESARAIDAEELAVRTSVASALSIALVAINAKMLSRVEQATLQLLRAHTKLEPVRSDDLKQAEASVVENFARVAKLFAAVTAASGARTRREAHSAMLSGVRPYKSPHSRAIQLAVAPWLTPTLLNAELSEAASKAGVRLLAYAMYHALQEERPVMHLVRIRGAWFLLVYAVFTEMIWHDAHVLRLRYEERSRMLFFETGVGVERVELGRKRVYAMCSRRHSKRAALFVAMHLMRSVGATLIVPNTQALAELRADKSMAELLPALTDPFEATFTNYHAEVAEWAKLGVVGERHAATYGRSILAMLRMHGVHGELELDASSVCSLLLPHDEHYRVADYETDVRPLLEELKSDVEESTLEVAKALMTKMRGKLCAAEKLERSEWNEWHRAPCFANDDKSEMPLAQMLSAKATHLLHPTMLALYLLKYIKESSKLLADFNIDNTTKFVAGLPDLPGQYAYAAKDANSKESNGKWVMLYWAFVAMYDAIQRDAALQIGAAYEAHTRRAITGVSSRAGVACKMRGKAGEALKAEPSVMPLHLVPLGVYVYAPVPDSKNWTVWRRTQLARFDKYMVRPGESEHDASKNVSVTYAHLNAQLKRREIVGVRGPLYDVTELLSGVDASETRYVAYGSESGVTEMLHFEPDVIQTVYAAELDELLRHIKQIEREGQMTMQAVSEKFVSIVEGGLGAVVDAGIGAASGALAVGVGAGILAAAVPLLTVGVGVAGMAAAGSAFVATGSIAGVAGSVVGGAVGLAPQKAARAALHVKERLTSGTGGMFSKLSDIRRLLPYADSKQVQDNVSALLDDQSSGSRKGTQEEKRNLLQAAAANIAKNAAGPEYDPLSMETAMLERARETSLLARDAMNAVIEAL